jgi:predicted deacylase
MTSRARKPLAIALALAAVAALTLGVTRPSEGTAADATTSTRIGTSAQGRPIDVGCLGSGDQTVLVIGGMHTGPEAHSSELVLELAKLAWGGDLEIPEGARLCLLPTLNPDGLARGTRTNARGVDLNRNWPSLSWTSNAYHPEGGAVSGGKEPLSEPETRALWLYILQTRPDAVLVMHCCGAVVEANESGRAVEMADVYSAGVSMQHIALWTAYPVTGQFIDAMDRIGIAAIDVEMADLLDIDLESHREGVEHVLARLADRPVDHDQRAQASNATPPSGWTTYRVRPGDTLANIAGARGTTATSLAVVNRLSRPELIEVGQVLKVPR